MDIDYWMIAAGVLWVLGGTATGWLINTLTPRLSVPNVGFMVLIWPISVLAMMGVEIYIRRKRP